MLKYRGDIDGIRAIAVCSVVLYHFFPFYVRGGYVGVDVFFVISGYLITSIVQASIDSKKFDLFDFYRRRILRIFPALFFLYFAIFCAAFIIYLPYGFQDLTRNAISSILFVSNIQFLHQSGYFDDASKLNPLLHTWSLSVEEQFYVFLPIILYFCRGLSRNLRATGLLVIFFVSLGAASWQVYVNQPATFYLLQYRVWEFVFGSALALGMVPTVRSAIKNNIVAVAGLLLVGASIFAMPRDIAFPGLSAVPACLGAMLLIHSGARQATIVSRFLSLRPVRFIGATSYSFYLWHWPVLVMAQHMYGDLGRFERVLLILLSFALATLSWRFIESPFRSRSISARSPVVVMGGGALMLATIGFAAILPQVYQAYWNVSEAARTAESFMKYDYKAAYRYGSCFVTPGSQNYRFQDCLTLSDTKPNFVLMGDSHAAHIYPGLSANRDVNVVQATFAGCKPVLNGEGDAHCTKFVSYMLKDYLPKHHVNTIVLSARWAQDDIAAVRNTVQKLAGLSDRILVLGPILEYDMPLPNLLATGLYRGNPDLQTAHQVAGPQMLDQGMRQALAGSSATYLSTYEAVCPAGACAAWAQPGTPLQFDYGHLTAEGSRLVVSRLAAQIYGPWIAKEPQARPAGENITLLN